MNIVVEITVNNCKLYVIILLYCWHNIAVIFSFLFYSSGVTTAPADLAMQGETPCLNYFLAFHSSLLCVFLLFGEYIYIKGMLIPMQ